MSISTRRSARGMTLVEVMIAATLGAVVLTLMFRAMVDVHRFYNKVSDQSRQVGSALVVLDKIEATSFGLPRQAITQSTSPSGGQLLVVQPFSTLASSGTAVYASKRLVFENSSAGVVLWEIEDEAPGLGEPLSTFPPSDLSKARKTVLLGPGWRFASTFKDGNFPLLLTVTPPTGSGGHPFQRSVEGYH